MATPTLLGTAAAETVAHFVNRSTRSRGCHEDVRIRNFDATAHDVYVHMTAVEGDTTVQRTYHLPPETTACLVNELDDGHYDIAVTLDGDQHAIATCRIDDNQRGTVVIETGNGIVSVSDGIP